jgi:hypothetical protein
MLSNYDPTWRISTHSFDADDIVVSCRHIHSVFVIDTETERIKWLSSRFLRQHDVDFVGNGYIQIFDNNSDTSINGAYLGGSRIVAVNPAEDVFRLVCPKTNGPSFYTPHGGKAQRLTNGNLLITEARRGRVFEVDESGRTVWEWVQDRHDSELVPEVLEGTRYALTPEQVAAWKITPSRAD